ncbi:MAG TPA: hypothetical protein VER33_26675 [Polyangiaceae bacterium]|nr:hypothetical protein [Polyangiaceae bacterium]
MAVCWTWASRIRPGDAGGWVGSWSPGIGDPSVLGWLTVVLYIGTAGYCWLVGRRLKLRSERLVFFALAAGLFALGINKQLDLQSALTEVGRILARRQDWYEQRAEFQKIFIVQVAVLALVGLGLIVWLTRASPLPTRAALAGAVLLSGFVVMRAASFHHVDLFIGAQWLGIRANWVLEIGGILAVLAAAHWRDRYSRSTASGARRSR